MVPSSRVKLSKNNNRRRKKILFTQWRKTKIELKADPKHSKEIRGNGGKTPLIIYLSNAWEWSVPPSCSFIPTKDLSISVEQEVVWTSEPG